MAHVLGIEASARTASAQLSAHHDASAQPPASVATAGLGAGYTLSPDEIGDDDVERAVTPPDAGAASSPRRSATGATGNGNANANANANANPNPDPSPNADANTNPNTVTNANTNPNPNTNPN